MQTIFFLDIPNYGEGQTSVTLQESGLVGEGIVIRIGSFLVKFPLGTWSGLGTQPLHNASGDLLVENVNMQ